MDQISLKDTPDEVLSNIAEVISQYLSSLLRVTDDPPGVDRVELIGSGTFVHFHGVYGILAAHHIARAFSDDCFLGLSIARENEEGDFKIRSESLEILEIAKPATKEYGPDLAFISIEDSDRSQISEDKTFYPIDKHKTEVLDKAPPGFLEKPFERKGLAQLFWCA